MIIDTHVHIGTFDAFNMTPADVLYSMELYGIDFSLVSSGEAVEFDHMGKPVPKALQKPQNTVFRDTLRFARENTDRIGAVPWLKILSELPDEEFKALLRGNRDLVYAFKLHPFHSRPLHLVF